MSGVSPGPTHRPVQPRAWTPLQLGSHQLDIMYDVPSLQWVPLGHFDVQPPLQSLAAQTFFVAAYDVLQQPDQHAADATQPAQ